MYFRLTSNVFPDFGSIGRMKKKIIIINYKKSANSILETPASLPRSLETTRLWSAICFKIMTRYTCGFFPRILAIIPATRYTCVFLPRILTFFLTNAHIYAHKKAHIKQACGIWGHRKSSYKRHRIIPSAKNPFMYDGAEK